MSITEQYFIDLYNTTVQEINDELEGMGIRGEREISKASQAKIETVRGCEDLSHAYIEWKQEQKGSR
jgi:hypothetical protein